MYDKNGNAKTFRQHRVILDTFYDFDKSLEVDHVDKAINNHGESNGNRLCNLEAVTKDENNKRKNENYEYKHTKAYFITQRNNEFFKKYSEEKLNEKCYSEFLRLALFVYYHSH